MATSEPIDPKACIPCLQISAKIHTLGASEILSGAETHPQPSDAYILNSLISEDAHDQAAAKQLTDIATWTKHDVDAFNVIVEHVDDNMITKFGNKTTSATIWKIVLSVNQDTHSGVTAFYIKIGIIEHKYIDGNPMANHIGWIWAENQCLLGIKKGLDDKFLALLLLHSLPKTEQWARLISNTIEATSDTIPLTVTHIKSQLLHAESLMKEDPAHGQSALAVAARQPQAKIKHLVHYPPIAERGCTRLRTAKERVVENLVSPLTLPQKP
jgi:gag-polypeptide of LTR copia-type